MRSKSTRNYYLTQYAYSSISREVSPKRDKRGILREELASETPKTPEEHGESLATFGTAGAEKSRGPKWRHLC